MDTIRRSRVGAQTRADALHRSAHTRALHWHHRARYAYPTLLTLGSIAGIVTATRLAPWLGLPPGRTYAALLLLLIPALAGSRLFFVLMHWSQFRDNPRSIWRANGGGLALYGGLVLTLVSAVPLTRVLRLPAAEFADAACLVILIGMAFTKVGCHLNGCCAGRRSTAWWSLDTTNARGERARRLPAQLLEGALAVVLVATAIIVRAQMHLAGSLFLTGAVGYGIGRFLLEGIRDHAGRERDVAINRAISAVLALGATATLWMLALSR